MQSNSLPKESFREFISGVKLRAIKYGCGLRTMASASSGRPSRRYLICSNADTLTARTKEPELVWRLCGGQLNVWPGKWELRAPSESEADSGSNCLERNEMGHAKAWIQAAPFGVHVLAFICAQEGAV